jgi:hypothetical protein
MGVTISIVLTVILIALIVMSRRNQVTDDNRAAHAGHGQARRNTQFHAVSIQSVDSACEAAKGIQGQRFLSSAAPRLPLPECDAAECRCRFAHHKDRRSGEDRRGSHARNMIADTGGFDGKERRYRGDRRGNDPQNFFA